MLKLPDPCPSDCHALRDQQRPLQPRIAAVAAEAATRRNDTVIRHARRAGAFHDVADRPRGTGGAGQPRHLSVRRHPANRNASDHRQYTTGKRPFNGQR